MVAWCTGVMSLMRMATGRQNKKGSYLGRITKAFLFGVYIIFWKEKSMASWLG